MIALVGALVPHGVLTDTSTAPHLAGGDSAVIVPAPWTLTRAALAATETDPAARSGSRVRSLERARQRIAGVGRRRTLAPPGG